MIQYDRDVTMCQYGIIMIQHYTMTEQKGKNSCEHMIKYDIQKCNSMEQ